MPFLVTPIAGLKHTFLTSLCKSRFLRKLRTPQDLYKQYTDLVLIASPPDISANCLYTGSLAHSLPTSKPMLAPAVSSARSKLSARPPLMASTQELAATLEPHSMSIAPCWLSRFPAWHFSFCWFQRLQPTMITRLMGRSLKAWRRLIKWRLMEYALRQIQILQMIFPTNL